MAPSLPWVEPARTFLGATADWEKSRVVLVGAPLDVTSSFRPGTRFAPQRIREVSVGLEEYSLLFDRSLRQAALFDAGDLLLAPGAVGPSLDRVEECVAWLAAQGKKVALLGGEHLLTYAAVRGLAAAYEGLIVLHWDAHADRRQEYLGQELSHATVMHLVARLGIPLYQMGIRSLAPEEVAAVRPLLRRPALPPANRGDNPVPGGQAGSEDVSGGLYLEDLLAGLWAVLPALRSRPVYLSCDIDVLDPAYAPGTGTPEPGGVTPGEIFRAVGHLPGVNLVGFDLVEVNPLVDVGDCTSLLAAKITRELILACSLT